MRRRKHTYTRIRTRGCVCVCVCSISFNFHSIQLQKSHHSTSFFRRSSRSFLPKMLIHFDQKVFDIRFFFLFADVACSCLLPKSGSYRLTRDGAYYITRWVLLSKSEFKLACQYSFFKASQCVCSSLYSFSINATLYYRDNIEFRDNTYVLPLLLLLTCS